MFCKYSPHNQIQKRSANTRNTTKYRNVLQILTKQPNTETLCKYSQHNQIQKCAANIHKTTKYRNVLQILPTQPNTETFCKYSQHNQIQKCSANTPNTTKCRNVLQILPTQPNTETFCKYSQHNQIQKCSANTPNTTKYRNVLQILATQQIQKRSANIPNTTKYRNVLQILLTQPNTEMFCKYSQHNQIQKCSANIPNTIKYRNSLHMCCQTEEDFFLNLLVFFLFACVFLSCSTFSSFGHRTWAHSIIFLFARQVIFIIRTVSTLMSGFCPIFLFTWICTWTTVHVQVIQRSNTQSLCIAHTSSWRVVNRVYFKSV